MSRILLAGILLAALPASAQDAGTAPAWDEPVAAALVHALNERPLPGFEGAVFTPRLACTGKSSWMISFFTPTPYRKLCCVVDDDTRACGYNEFNCLDGDPCIVRKDVLAAKAPQLDSVAELARGFTGAVPAPPDASVSIAQSSSASYPLFMLRSFRGKDGRTRALLSVEAQPHAQWVVTDDLAWAGSAWEGQPDPSFTPLRLERPQSDEERWFLVWSVISGGMGNNASGFEHYTGVLADRQEEALRVVATIPLGDATWSRSIGDRGFHESFTSDLLCPSFWSRGVALKQACPASPDPRGLPKGYAFRCGAACPRPPKPDPRAGYYFLRGAEFVHAQGSKVRGPRGQGELQIVERPEPNATGVVEYVEVKNATRDILDLSGVRFVSGTGEDEQVSTLGAGCVVDAGGLIVLGDPRVEGVEACPLENGHAGQGRLELRTPAESGNRLLAGSDKTWPDKDWSELGEKPLSVLQRDAKGRQCIAAPSPGLPNPPCP